MDDTAEIELSLTNAKVFVERRDMLNKLMSNREFKKVIVEGYFKDESVRLVSLLGDPAMESHREEIIRSMDGISQLQVFLRTVVQTGNMAAQSVKEYEAALEDMRNDDAITA